MEEGMQQKTRKQYLGRGRAQTIGQAHIDNGGFVGIRAGSLT